MQVEAIELLNEVIQVALGEDADILSDQWPKAIVDKGVWRISREKEITPHNVGDGYYLVFKVFKESEWEITNPWADTPEPRYCKAVLHAACAIRDWILQLNASKNEGYEIGIGGKKLNFRMVVHYGEYRTPEGLKLGDSKGTRLLIGDALNDSTRMIATRGEGTLNTMYVSEQVYEQLPVRWRHSYFDGSLIQQDDSKGKRHNFYKCVPPPAWMCDHETGDVDGMLKIRFRS